MKANVNSILPEMGSSKSSGGSNTLMWVVGLAIVGVAGYYYYNNYYLPSKNKQQ